MQHADDGRDVRCARLAIADDLRQGSPAYVVYPGGRAAHLDVRRKGVRRPASAPCFSASTWVECGTVSSNRALSWVGQRPRPTTGVAVWPASDTRIAPGMETRVTGRTARRTAGGSWFPAGLCGDGSPSLVPGDGNVSNGAATSKSCTSALTPFSSNRIGGDSHWLGWVARPHDPVRHPCAVDQPHPTALEHAQRKRQLEVTAAAPVP